jgi:D-alanyl-D-alanine carboxypeptidase
MAAALLAAGLTLGACGGTAQPAATTTQATTAAATQTATQTQGIDYKALVNKLNPLPEGWEDALETVTIKNSLGDDVEVEKKAYDAYLALKADLEKEGVHVDLDSARRSVAEQQRIMDEFTEKYGADYAKKTVATPGYSEHHTGLALDLFLIIDGKGVYLNEDMVQHPEIWENIHAIIADHGFILRYLPERNCVGAGY